MEPGNVLTMNVKRIGAVLAVLFAVFIGAMLLPGNSGTAKKPLASAALGDGRILQVDAVTYGTNHQVGDHSSMYLRRLRAWLPRRISAFFEPKNPQVTINGLDHPALVVWVSAVSVATGTNVDCQGLRVELVNEQGEHFESAFSSWYGGYKFWRVGHVFEVYPRDEARLTLEVTGWRTGKTNVLEFPNPHVVRPAAWTGQDLPQQKPAGDLTIVLAGLGFRTNGVPGKYYSSRLVSWEPVWELRRGGETVDGWNEPEWHAEDAIGNFGKYLGTNQPVLRVSARFYPTVTNAAAQVLTTLAPTVVTKLHGGVWWNQPAKLGSNNLTVVGFFPAGDYVFQDGIMLTNPPVRMGAVGGGAPSGWTGQDEPVGVSKVVHYDGHYSTKDSVIYVSAPHLDAALRLAVRLRDEQGRVWEAKPESQGAAHGVYPFLVALPPGVIRATPELVLLKPVEAEFMVNVPGTNTNRPTQP